MTIVVNQKLCELLPLGLRRRARLKLGDRLEVKASGGVITMIAKLPSADDEYTPAQRRIIDAQLAEAEEDIRAGRIIGPFNTADEMIASMKSQLKKKAPARKPKRPAKLARKEV